MSETDGTGTVSKSRRSLRAVLPERLKAVYDVGGIWALIIFIAGFMTAAMIAVGIFYSGKIPISLLPAEYKNNSPVDDSARIKPNSINVQIIKQSPDWVNPIKNWLQSEGSKRKSERLISDFMTEAVETQELPSTNEFKWVLKASSADYSIVGWGFKISGANQSQQVTPLERKKSVDTRDAMVFEIPKCEKGDRLIAIIRMSWEKQLTPVDFLSTFRSIVD